MGIPSYYKRLCDRINGLIKSTKPVEVIHWLWVDFNCMIYHCLQREDTEKYPEEAVYDDGRRILWEDTFIRSVENYLEKVVKQVRPTEGIFIGVDGVVPLAKMRQQRQRRFKGAWERKMAGGGEQSWDKNAITPGTEFMNRLCRHLAKTKKFPGSKYVFSGVDEPGEGEHKVMDAWRSMNIGKKKNALYGLDADLIVLSMLNRNFVGDVWLFREEVKEGQIVRTEDGEEKFIWFDIQTLENTLGSHSHIGQKKWLENYLFAMSTLGNDFLPAGLSLKLREDGHDRLQQALDNLREKDQGLRGLQVLFRDLAQDEPNRIKNFIARKSSQGDSIGVETGLGQKNWPLAQVWENEGRLLEESSARTLVPGWEEQYLKMYFHGASRDEICQEYLRGLRWTWNYYRGIDQPDKWTWLYPWHMPPLWSWLVKYLDRKGLAGIDLPGGQGDAATAAQFIPKPLEQLTLVLPMESWHLIPCPRHRQFLARAPWYFPKRFSFFSTGRRFFWECEADIPIPTIKEIRANIGGEHSAFPCTPSG